MLLYTILANTYLWFASISSSLTWQDRLNTEILEIKIPREWNDNFLVVVWSLNEPCLESIVFVVLRKLILQTCMRIHPVRLDVWCLVTLPLLQYFMCANSEGSGDTVRMRRLAWDFAGHLYDKYHNLMSWLKYRVFVPIWQAVS